MANKKGLFGILNDGAGAGVGIDNANPGTTLGSAIDNTIASPAFVNSAGVLTFPALNADGTIPVSFASGTCRYDYGKVTGSTSFQDVAVHVAALTKLYSKIGFTAYSATEACWEVVYIDDVGGTPAETILATFETGPGQYSYCCDMSCVEVDTTGGTAVQNILIRGKLLDASGSELAATIWMSEF